MLRALGLRKAESSANLRAPGGSSKDKDNHIDLVLKEYHDFEITLKAMDYVLDDQTSKGIELIGNASKKENEEPIFVLGLGVIEFIEATLGFETETMKRAQKTLNEAENLSYKKKILHEKLQLKTSSLYPPGTQYAVTYAEANLLNALIMLLSESVIESAKALYKLRKAYHTLDEINKSINSHQQKKSLTDFLSPNDSLKKNVSTPNLKTYANDSKSTLGSFSDLSLTNNSSKTVITNYEANAESEMNDEYKDIIFKHVPVNLSSKQKKDIKILKLAEKIYQLKKSRIIGSNIGNGPAINRQRTDIGFSKANTDGSDASARPAGDSGNTSQMQNFSDDNDDFVDAEEELNEPKNVGENNAKNVTNSATDSDSKTTHDDVKKELLESIQANILSKAENMTIDEFIHSGVNLCFGILQVVLSLIPPAIGKVLSIVGFKGSRENGLKMLWRATTERNIHGGIAILGLLVFYDGPFQFTDTDFDIPSIGSDSEDSDEKTENGTSDIKSIQRIESDAFQHTGEATLLHPGKNLELALLKSRAYFPNSVLWLLQEGRMLASQGKLAEAIELMDSATDGTYKKIEMKQAEALLVFDKAMILVYLHQYERAAEHFLRLIDLNSWSHALYTYIAGSCYLENYRMCRTGVYKLSADDSSKSLEEKAQYFKKLANKYLLKAPTYLQGAKKGFFQSKQMPMDRYLLRKIGAIKKLHETKYPKLDFVDCIGTSLVHEVSYFWNAYNRMDQENLQLSLKLLGYSGMVDAKYSINVSNVAEEGENTNYSFIKETEQDSMLRYFLQSLTLRRLGKVKQGLQLIDTYVIKDKVLAYDGLPGTGPSSASGLISIKSNKSTSTANFASEHSLNGSKPSRYIKRAEDPWLYPTALYERAIFCWKMRGLDGIEEVKDWLRKAINYADDYELSARTGMKIKAAMDRLEGY